jgi:Cu-Zn family superoxide dismutase
MKHLLLLSAAAALAACGNTDGDTIVDSATETMTMEQPTGQMPELMTQSFAVMNTAGFEIGQVTIADQAEGGVTLDLDVTAIPAGSHAIHFHTNGACDLPDFTSAGGHYNPMDANHGFDASAPNPHAGDMPNFDAPDSGVVKTQISNERVSLSIRDGYAPLFDADNTALIIHAGSDDYKTQPTGAAGGRIACAVIAP